MRYYVDDIEHAGAQQKNCSYRSIQKPEHAMGICDCRRRDYHELGRSASDFLGDAVDDNRVGRWESGGDFATQFELTTLDQGACGLFEIFRYYYHAPLFTYRMHIRKYIQVEML